MTCIDVVGRYFLNSPLDGATELTQLMMGLIVFAILPTVCYREEHVSVDLLDLLLHLALAMRAERGAARIRDAHPWPPRPHKLE